MAEVDYTILITLKTDLVEKIIPNSGKFKSKILKYLCNTKKKWFSL